ncbi:MAG: hypothetical protein JRG73_12300 [Deltaproteobacteria bacterium]|nr:hypothetical protein [Deltaproteobacteria bacterium]
MAIDMSPAYISAVMEHLPKAMAFGIWNSLNVTLWLFMRQSTL